MAIQTLGLSPPEKRSDPFNNPAVPLNAVADWMWLGGGSDTEAGEIVSTETALQQATVYTCVNLLARSVSSLPLELFRTTASGKVLDQDHPLSYLLSCEPNSEMDKDSFIECLMGHLVLTGNCYAQIQRNADGQPIALWPLMPRETKPYRLPNGTLVYRTQDAGVDRILKAADVLHCKTFAWDGLLGMSPIMQAKRLIGASIAEDKFSSRFFANSSMPQVVMTTKAKMKPEDKTKARRDWESLQAGSNQHRVAILDGEMSIEKLSLTNEESQFLQTRQMNRATIGAIFGIDSHRLGSEIRQTDSNVEAMNETFISQTLEPYFSKFASEITRKLLPHEPGKHSDFSVAFNTSKMLKGTQAARSAWATAGRNAGYLTANDCRRAEGLNGGGPELDVFITQIQYQNSERLLTDPKAAPETVVPNA